MILFKDLDFNIELSDKDQNYCKFSVLPLSKNFGITIGNALRRILLNSLPGVAVFAVEIKDVVHEFSTISGIVEDVTQIIFNLRKVIFRSKTDFGGFIKLKINKKGSGKVLASDIELPSNVDIVNPNMEIANLTDSGNLEMFIYIRIGTGYATAEINQIENKVFGRDQGIIYVDSNYSSILNANYKVENIYDKNDIFEKLIFEVKTNGLFTPQQAIANAANILIAHLNKFANIEKELQKITFKKDIKIDDVKHEEADATTILDLDLSVRSTNALKRAGIETLEDLIKKTPLELKKIHNLGKKSAAEILEKLKKKNIFLREQQFEETTTKKRTRKTKGKE
ncbi:MAG: DNA-directed RNA polymerase subunit alpha [Bacilli bacterium]|nr:DNA-directed RNA polymerase subunit alpha [Bacilli bacterium]